jgi:GTPase Era involved in 16S rRNA processing
VDGVVREQEPLNMLDQRMMQNVRQATKDADAVLVIVDANDRPEEALPMLQPYCRKGSVPLAVILNKVYELKKHCPESSCCHTVSRYGPLL